MLQKIIYHHTYFHRVKIFSLSHTYTIVSHSLGCGGRKGFKSCVKFISPWVDLTTKEIKNCENAEAPKKLHRLHPGGNIIKMAQ
jgi:hypothetical protein